MQKPEGDGLRASLRAALLRRLTERAKPLEDRDLARPALVVAPHPDDESLGCGGTICRKRGLGAAVTICFLTDGAHSHDRYADPAEMRVRRRAEALQAAAALGVEEGDVAFVDIEDGRLAEHESSATGRLHALLAERRPTEVYLPSRYEMPADHVAAYRAALAAVRANGEPMTLHEYPVWLWQHFPWSAAQYYVGKSRRARALAALRANRRLFAGFRTRCDLGRALEGKRRALAAHASQTTRLAGYERWPTLRDVSAGEFFACFDRGVEFFHTTEVSGAR